MASFNTWAELQSDLQRRGLRPGDPSTQGIEQARAQHETYLAALQEGEQCDGNEQLLNDGATGGAPRCLLVRPQGLESADIGILYLRGAGWWGGSLASSRPVLHRLARETGCPVCAVDYRRTPEHAFPSQLDDVLVVMDRWIGGRTTEAGPLPNRWVIWGESAGASLALCAASRWIQTRESSRLCGLTLLYGNHAGPHVDSPRTRWLWDRYLANTPPQQHERAFALHQKLEGLPPTWVAVGEEDPLLFDSQQMQKALHNAGVSSTLRIMPGLPHSFAAMAPVLRPAARAFSECAAAARALGVSAQPPAA